MLLAELLRQAGIDAPCPNLFVTRISQDSRQVQAGDLFVGVREDELGKRYIQQALSQGARVIVACAPLCASLQSTSKDVLWIPVPFPRLALSRLAAAFYASQPAINVAVTGTNGKSSVVTFVRQLWQRAGLKAASLGTLGVELGADLDLPPLLAAPTLTTPDALALPRVLNELATLGITHTAFEASSHGLDQYRLHSVELTSAAFTNLSPEHLDYHKSMEEYGAAKEKLFTEILKPGKVAVVHKNSPYFSGLAEKIQARGQRLVSYGIAHDRSFIADIMASEITMGRHPHPPLSFTLTVGEKSWPHIPLFMHGAFQVENVLCAIGLAMASGLTAEEIVSYLPALRNPVGRMDYVAEGPRGGQIYVDFGHKPAALQAALESLRQALPVPDAASAKPRLLVVFGCGGDRDQEKRPHMGRIAAELADKVFVTDDNPRFENPQTIRAQILAGCPQAVEVPDRREAIGQAMAELGPHDILLIAGKGHEQYQIIGNESLPFSDQQEVLAQLQRSKPSFYTHHKEPANGNVDQQRRS